MISERQYYQFIYKRLIEKNMHLFADCDESNLVCIEMPKERFSWFYELLDCVEKNYGFDMQKILLPNYNKFMLWQECFMQECKPENIEIAMQFIVFCCLADKILDSKRFSAEQKTTVMNKLNIKHFTSNSEYISNEFQELDRLLNNIRRFMEKLGNKNAVELKKIWDCMERAFQSEIYMASVPLLQREKSDQSRFGLLTDKSVQFEIAAFLLASLGENTANTQKAALDVANIFWQIDDLCDLTEDIKAKRRNSMLFLCVQEKNELTLAERAQKCVENAEKFILMLEENIRLLKMDSNDAFYTYVVNEVWEWCSHVRTVALKGMQG